MKNNELHAPIPFRLVALAAEQFEPLFSLTDQELLERGARRCTVDSKPGYPCRVSLSDADVGEEVILLPFTHHAASSPYQAAGPIFVGKQATRAVPAVNEIPAMFRHRLLSVRAYDSAAMLVGADVCDGSALPEQIQRFFQKPDVDYLHIHNARPGCYNCRVERA